MKLRHISETVRLIAAYPDERRFLRVLLPDLVTQTILSLNGKTPDFLGPEKIVFGLEA